MDNSITNKFGYCEMYEWLEIPNNTSLFGKIVQFSHIDPGKIELYDGTGTIVGVSSINSLIESDNPTEWQGKNLADKYGDIYLKKSTIIKSKKCYDDVEELSYISTFPEETITPIINNNYDSSKNFIPRTDRLEWIRVCLLGKCIIEDDGSCIPGKFCSPYVGHDKSLYGTCTHSEEKTSLYVIARISSNTILALNKGI